MKKILNTIIVSLFILLVTCGASFAAVTLPSNITNENGTLVLSGNATLEAPLTITGTTTDGEYPITAIDLKGFTLSTTNANNLVINNSEGKPLSVNGPGTITGTGGAFISLSPKANATFTNVTITGTKAAGSSNYALFLDTGSNLTLDGCKLTATNYYGIYVGAAGEGDTTQLNVNNKSELTGIEYPAIATDASAGNDAIYDINVNNSTVTGTNAPAIFSSNINTDVDITNSTITGQSAIFVRGGSITIDQSTVSATGTADVLNKTYDSGYFSTGDAIVIAANALQAETYGDIDITIENGSKVSSANGYAINQVNGDGEYSTSYSGLDKISVTNSTLTGKTAALPSDGFEDQDGDPVEEYIGNGTTVNGEVPENALVDGIQYVVSNDGTYTYFVNQSDAENYASENGGTVQTLADWNQVESKQYTLYLNDVQYEGTINELVATDIPNFEYLVYENDTLVSKDDVEVSYNSETGDITVNVSNLTSADNGNVYEIYLFTSNLLPVDDPSIQGLEPNIIVNYTNPSTITITPGNDSAVMSALKFAESVTDTDNYTYVYFNNLNTNSNVDFTINYNGLSSGLIPAIQVAPEVEEAIVDINATANSLTITIPAYFISRNAPVAFEVGYTTQTVNALDTRIYNNPYVNPANGFSSATNQWVVLDGVGTLKQWTPWNGVLPNTNQLDAFQISGNPMKFYATNNYGAQQSSNFNLALYSTPNHYAFAPSDTNFIWALYKQTTDGFESYYTFDSNGWYFPTDSSNYNYDAIKNVTTGTAYNYGDYGWYLSFDYTYTGANSTTNTPASITFSNLALNFTGGGGYVDEGIYFLNAQYTPLGISENIYDSSVTVVVEESDVARCYIEDPNGNIINSIYTLNLNQSPYAQFKYQALDKDGLEITGSVINWSIEATNPSALKYPLDSYAKINPTTGYLTVYRNIPSGTYLYLYLTVDGTPNTNRPVLLNVQGTNSSTDLTGIAAIKDNIYVANRGRVVNAGLVQYDLIDNIVGLPLDTNTYLETADVTFTSSNSTELPVINGSILSPYTGYVGSTVITATLGDYSTQFTVNVIDPVPAQGIASVVPELYFDFGSTQLQNVNAVLTPYNTTIDPVYLTYSSDDESVAIVDEYGYVQAVGTGTATITTQLELTNTAVGSADYGQTYYITKTTEVIVGEYSPVTEIILDPTNINLSVNGDTTSDTITATLMPAGSVGTVQWSIEPETVATIEADGNTATVQAVANGVATVTATYGNVKATATVTVSDAPVVAQGGIAITSTSPDYFTITAYDVVSTVPGAEVQQMSAFAWSNDNQSDINAKVMENVPGTNNWTITMPVNETPVNQYFDYADDIKINVYGSVVEGDNGDMIYANTYKWVNGLNIGNHSVAYIAYCQDIGFDMPTVFDGAEAGTTGENRQLEGVRISSGIEGVEIVTDIHVQDIGWLYNFADGEYAGTMHQNLQAEAINLHLEGENAANYTLTYRVHGENYGWTNWVTAGTVAGTTGDALQLEAIEVQLIPNN